MVAPLVEKRWSTWPISSQICPSGHVSHTEHFTIARDWEYDKIKAPRLYTSAENYTWIIKERDLMHSSLSPFVLTEPWPMEEGALHRNCWDDADCKVCPAMLQGFRARSILSYHTYLKDTAASYWMFEQSSAPHLGSTTSDQSLNVPKSFAIGQLQTVKTYRDNFLHRKTVSLRLHA